MNRPSGGVPAEITVERVVGASALKIKPLLAAFRVALRAYRGIASQADEAAAEEELRDFLKAGYPIYAARIADRDVGYMVCKTEAPTLWVEHLYVAEDCRRQGVASALFAQAEALAAEFGEDTVFNCVHPNNEGMIAFLGSRGYTVLNLIEIRKPYRGEKPRATINVNGQSFDY